MEDFKNPSINEIVCLCSAQSAKTETIMALVAWVIDQDPGPILWVTTNTIEARKFAKARLMPLLEQCAPIVDRMPKGRYDKTTTAIYFPGAPLFIVGAESAPALQSTPFRYIFLDEARSWKPGAPEMVSKRVRSYPYSYKKVTVSTPSEEGDFMDLAFRAGSQNHWHVTCPDCKTEFELDWGDEKTPGGVKWDTNEETVVEGQFIWEKLLETVRYQCWGCERAWRDTVRDRKLLGKSGKWVSYNENAPANVTSYTWNAILPYWPSLRMQVREGLEAFKALKTGAFAPLKDHITETRGKCWSMNWRFQKDNETMQDRVGDYSVQDHVAMAAALGRTGARSGALHLRDFIEARRFLTADVQGKGGRHYYIGIRAWEQGGRSRLLHQEKVWTLDDIRALAKEFWVNQDDIIFDTAHFTAELYLAILASGGKWKAFRGEKRDSFSGIGVDGKPVQQIWTKTIADPAIGTAMAGRTAKIPLFLFSKPSTCDRLHSMINGIIPGWEIHDDCDDEYLAQVNSYYRHDFTDSHGNQQWEWRSKAPKGDHYADMERMQIAAAAIHGLIG